MELLKANKQQCCGCTACVCICPNGCLVMSADNEGFLYPYIDKIKCDNCGMCTAVCPVGKYAENETEQHAYLVQNKDERILSESTSGGVFSAVAEYVAERNGVVFGAAYDWDLRVIHLAVKSRDDLYRFRNSKYVQSDLGMCYQETKRYLEEGAEVCFSGTPCQIYGLKSYLGKDYHKLLTVDFVCRSVPSPLVWERYKEYRMRNGVNIENIVFRNKDLYGYTYSHMKIQYENGDNEYYGIESDPYMRSFFTDLSARPCCYSCSFKKRYRLSDLTIWDCLDAGRYTRKLDNNKGVTRVLAHTQKGNEIIGGIGDKCRIEEIPAEEAVRGVREMTESIKENKQRDLFFCDISEMTADAFFGKYFPITFIEKAERQVRRFSAKTGIYRSLKRLINR